MKKLFLLLFLLLSLGLGFTVHAQVIITAVGGSSAGLGDGGPAVYAELNSPYGINLDDSGNLYICDLENSRIRKVSNPAVLGVGIITTIAGDGSLGYGGDNGLGIYAQIHGPLDVAIDHHGNVYFVDENNQCIRKITPADTITTIAGIGVAGYNGDSIPASTAQLNYPTGVAVDNIGDIYIADRFNHRIRKVDTAGIITTIAGIGVAGFSPDGSRADTAKLDKPAAIRIDKAGNLFFYDSAFIRKIDTAGIITTIAGNGIIGYSGDSGLAIAAEIGGGAIAIDSVGNLFIADEDYNHIRKVDTTGIITTIAGNGMSGFYGDNGNPLLAEFSNVAGVAVGIRGIYISDNGNSRIRLITDHPVNVNNMVSNEQAISAYPNPCHDLCSIMVSMDINEHADVIISDIMGRVLYTFSTATNKSYTIHPNLSPGVYIISAITEHEHINQKLIVE